jgi:hypothetical protein
MAVMAVIGLIPTVGIFVVCFMRYENRERWPLIITYAIILVVSITFVFEHVMHIPWPPTFLGSWVPWLKANVPSRGTEPGGAAPTQKIRAVLVKG